MRAWRSGVVAARRSMRACIEAICALVNGCDGLTGGAGAAKLITGKHANALSAAAIESLRHIGGGLFYVRSLACSGGESYWLLVGPCDREDDCGNAHDSANRERDAGPIRLRERAGLQCPERRKADEHSVVEPEDAAANLSARLYLQQRGKAHRELHHAQPERAYG